MTPQIAGVTTNLVVDGGGKEAATRRLDLGGAKATFLRTLFLSLSVALLVSSCAAAYVPAPLPVNHPASPAAPEAPPPPPSQAFSDGSVLPAPAEEMPAQGPHAGHGAMQGMHGGRH
jgi:hypothetical protein